MSFPSTLIGYILVLFWLILALHWCHFTSLRCHSGSFRYIPVPFLSIPFHSGVILRRSGIFRFIPVYSVPFRSVPFLCLVTPQQKVTIREFYFTCWPLGLRRRLLVDKGHVVSKRSCEGIAIFLLISAAENLFPSHLVATLCNDCVAGITALMCK